MRFQEIYRYEFEYRLKSPATWAYASFLMLLGGFVFTATGEGAGFINTPDRIALASTIASTIGLVVMAAIFGEAAVRDFQSGMDPMLFTSPIRKVDYLGGRLLAALSVNALIALAIPLGVFLCGLVMRQFEPDILGPFHPTAYVQPYVLLLIPNIMLGGAVLFAIGVLARHSVPVYLGAIGFLISAIAAMNALENTTNPILLLLSDPLGLSTFRGIIKYWTEAERNSRFIGFPAQLLLNRLFWLVIAGTVFVVLHRMFKFEHAGVGSSKRERRMEAKRASMATSVATKIESVGPVAVPRISGAFGSGTARRQTMAIARNSLNEIMGTRWFVVVILACTGLTLLWGWNVGSSAFDTSTWPVTFLITETVLSERVNPLIYALIALFAAELVWKDRNARVDEIADAVPVAESVLLAGSYLALVAMIFMFAAAMMVGGLIIQLLQQVYHVELWLYVRTLFGLNMASYLLFAVMAIVVQVLVNHKYLGHLALLLLFIAQKSLEINGFVQHHLLLYNTDPGWTYSDMNGFGPFVTAIVWFKLYWSAWAFVLAIVAVLFWIRGRESGLRSRLRYAFERLNGPVMRSAVVGVALIGGLGGFVFYNTNVLNTYRSKSNNGLSQALYEKRYRQFVNTKQPIITRTDLRVELYGEQSRADLSGTFSLVNKTSQSIDSVHVMFADPAIHVRSISFDRPAKAVVTDDEANYHIYALERALEPGDSAQLKFDLVFGEKGFSNIRARKEVVANGTDFNRKLLPLIGYQPVFELADTEARKRFGLAPKSPPSVEQRVDALNYRESVRDADDVAVHAIIGTSLDQTALTPGVLKREWTENGRRYFEYDQTPTSFGSLIVSGKYAVVQDKWRDVSLQIFHHPGHNENLDRTLKSMKASLDYYTEQFGPYPDKQLRIVEIPRYGGFGSAHPNLITFTEEYFLSRVMDGEVDQPFYGTAHEVAHTWWGGLKGASVAGVGFLTESAANYSAMMVTEKTYGREAARRVYNFQMDRYLAGRANQSNEVPALEVEDQSYIAYRKGAIALYTLREEIGDTAVNTAMRRFQDRFRNAGPPYATSRDLYAELKKVTPDSLQTLLTDWFETVTIWDVRTHHAVVEKLASGEYAVTLEIEAKKERADKVGKVTETPMDDLVEIGVFAPGDDSRGSNPLYLQRHRIKSGKQKIRIVVPKEPDRAGIDPRWKLIDRERPDNVIEVERRQPPF